VAAFLDGHGALLAVELSGLTPLCPSYSEGLDTPVKKYFENGLDIT
jgi:hypothetical protein